MCDIIIGGRTHELVLRRPRRSPPIRTGTPWQRRLPSQNWMSEIHQTPLPCRWDTGSDEQPRPTISPELYFEPKTNLPDQSDRVGRYRQSELSLPPRLTITLPRFDRLENGYNGYQRTAARVQDAQASSWILAAHAPINPQQDLFGTTSPRNSIRKLRPPGYRRPPVMSKRCPASNRIGFGSVISSGIHRDHLEASL